MSVAWSNRVWKSSRASGARLLVLLALADNADDETGIAWPSIGYLCTKTRMKERRVQYALRWLVKADELAVTLRTGRSNLYRLQTSGGAKTVGGAKTGEGAPICTEGVLLLAPRIISEPSEASTRGSQKPQREAKSLTTALDPAANTEKSKGRATRLPADLVLSETGRAYALAQGCRDPQRVFESFVLHFRANGKSMVDWWATFQGWVRNAHGGPEWKACGCGGLPRSRQAAPRHLPAALPEDKPERSAEAIQKVRDIVKSIPWAK